MESQHKHSPLRTLIAIGAFVLLIFGAAPLVGSTSITYSELFDPAGADYAVFWKLRVPRVCLGFLVGAGLAVGGVVFQALFRNPLASPFTLGVSSGAAFGAALFFQLGAGWSIGFLSGATIFALIGALISVAAVWGLSLSRVGIATTSLLLSGVVMSFFFSSLILFVQYLCDFAEVFQLTRWLMGSLSIVGFSDVLAVLGFVSVGLFLALRNSRELNLFSFGPDIAQGRGVEVQRTREFLFVGVSLMVGGVVAVCGPIGFVGIMVPHIARLLVGYRHELLLPASALLGGGLLVLCDTAARTVIAPYEIPVGVITALLGGPFFLGLLARARNISL